MGIVAVAALALIMLGWAITSMARDTIRQAVMAEVGVAPAVRVVAITALAWKVIGGRSVGMA